ncbi:peptidase M61 domain-containing protein [Leptolyngbya sp. NIES-3755]|nr:peptidase M61 domain-containing protein [Leptolyngbya sp. NIES-3755]
MNDEGFEVARSLQSEDESSNSSPPSTLSIHYWVAMPAPESHLFEVTLRIEGWKSPTLDLKMPVWTPGSYLVREYSRHLQNFKSEHPWQKLAKNHYQIDTQGKESIEVRYQIFANELTVRTNHLDENHGYFNGAALFFYVPGFEKQPIRVSIVPPRADWKVVTALSEVGTNTFEAKDFDTLVDSPFEVGQHQIYSFEVLGKSHQFVVWGEGKLDIDRIVQDTKKVIEVEAEIFGGLPYDRYFFLLHLTANSFGGLEHKDCCSLIYSRLGFRAKEKYDRFIQLVAHEFFHLWNVKRIRPKALEVFDYDRENYTPSLWFSEGTTSFYDLAFPYRAGVYDAKAYLSALGQEISRYLTTPGRLVQPLSESSFDAWIKLYRPDSNSANSQISYYLKGEMVTLLLDLGIRIKHQNQRSFDDVMRIMWQQFGKDEIGFTPEQLKTTIESVAGFDLTNFFDRYLHGTEELPFDEYLAGFGLRLKSNSDNPNLAPFAGMTVKSENGREMIKFVEAGSPAQKAAIDPGDELLAMDGLRVSSGQFDERLKDYQPGDTVTITVFHGDELKQRSLTLGQPRATSYSIDVIENSSTLQQQNFEQWLGVPLASISR